MSNHLDEVAAVISELEALKQKARKAAHNFAKSFSDHPNGCVYCEASGCPHELLGAKS